MALLAIDSKYYKLREPFKEILDKNEVALLKRRNDLFYVDEFIKNRNGMTCRVRIDKTGDIHTLKVIKDVTSSGACCAGLIVYLEADGANEYESFKSCLELNNKILKENHYGKRFAEVTFSEKLEKLSSKVKGEIDTYINRRVIDEANSLKLSNNDKIKVLITSETNPRTGEEYFKSYFYVMRNRINDSNGTPGFYRVEGLSASRAIPNEEYTMERKSNRSIFEKFTDLFKKPELYLPEEKQIEYIKEAFDNSLIVISTETSKTTYTDLNLHITDEKEFMVDYSEIDEFGDFGVSNNSYDSDGDDTM